MTETPPPEASPVKQLNWDQSTPKTVPKKALQKQIVTSHPGKEKKLTKAASKDEKTEVKEEHHDEKAIHEKVSCILRNSFAIISHGFATHAAMVRRF